MKQNEHWEVGLGNTRRQRHRPFEQSFMTTVLRIDGLACCSPYSMQEITLLFIIAVKLLHWLYESSLLVTHGSDAKPAPSSDQ